MIKPDFLHVDRDSWKLEVGVDIEMDVVRNGCGHSVLRTLKLAVCQGEMNRINWFLVC